MIISNNQVLQLIHCEEQTNQQSLFMVYYYRSICSYKGYFIRCNTMLFYDRYIYLCINNKYDKYLLLKNKYNDYIIFIKDKYKYYTYDNDLNYINNLFKKKYKWLKYNDLLFDNYKCLILDGNDIYEWR